MQENTIVAEGNVADNILAVNKITLEKILELDSPCDVLALYIFYSNVARWQKTNQVKATSDFCMNGLKIGRDRFSAAKKALLELNLIEEVVTKDDSGRVKGHYIKINYLCRKSTLCNSHTLESPHCGDTPYKCLNTYNEMLEDKNINASKKNNKKKVETGDDFGFQDGGNSENESPASTQESNNPPKTPYNQLLSTDSTNTIATKKKSRQSPKACEIDGLALPHPSDKFKTAWHEFLQHRREIRKPVTMLSAKKLLKVCGDMSEDDAIQSIERSIMNGWQGIFKFESKHQKSNDARDRQLLRENIKVRIVDPMVEDF
jgi:hypothetical protein